MAYPKNVPSIDRTGRGYFGVPDPPLATIFPGDPRVDPWLTWAVAIREAKQGSFVHLPRVLELYDPRGDPRFNYQVVILIGDAGPTRCFEAIRRELEEPSNPLDYEVGMNYSYALTIRGLLADIPLLAKVFVRYAVVEDADILPVRISGVLEDRGGDLSDATEFPSADAWLNAVIARYQALVDELGSDQVLLYRGKPFGVVRLAEEILASLQRPYFPPDLRRKFEASTGIDCSAFFKNNEIQPLAAAAIVEEFLESPEAAKYEDGVRYFFGHRIPD